MLRAGISRSFIHAYFTRSFFILPANRQFQEDSNKLMEKFLKKQVS